MVKEVKLFGQSEREEVRSDVLNQEVGELLRCDEGLLVFACRIWLGVIKDNLEHDGFSCSLWKMPLTLMAQAVDGVVDVAHGWSAVEGGWLVEHLEVSPLCLNTSYSH